VGILVAGLIQIDPTGAFRNPAKLERMQTANQTNHGIFLSLFGSDVVVGTGPAVMEHFRTFLRECSVQAAVRAGTAPDLARIEQEADEECQDVPEEIIASHDVGLMNHPVKAFSFVSGYGVIDAAHRAARPRNRDVIMLREWLDDETVRPQVLDRLASAYPKTVDRLYRLVLKNPKFRWVTDGDALLRRCKPGYHLRTDLPDSDSLPPIVLEAVAEVTRRSPQV